MRRLPLLALLFATPALAAGFQDIAALDRRIANALGAGIGQPGGASAPVDPRLKLAVCPEGVTLDPPAAGALAVRCASLGWRIRVPLTRFAGMQQAGYGSAQYPARADPVIRRGDPVELIASATGFSVSVAAIAQEDGAPGARIHVKSQNDGKPQNQMVFAEVIGPGQVRLPGFN